MTGRRARVGIALAFFAYIVLVRTNGIADSFLLLGEQIRDWNFALGTWWDLPLTGAPSTAGGRGLGPAYYWVLWLGRHLVGPFTSNLPHAGGLTISVLQAVGDTCLLFALMRRVPLALALAAALVIATQPFEVGLSAAIWNPPVAAASTKIALAILLGFERPASRWQLMAAAVIAWLGVQAHSSGALVAVPVFAAIVLQPALERDWTEATSRLVWLVAIVFVLEIPYLTAMLRSPAEAIAPTAAVQTLSNLAALDVPASFVRVTSVSGWLIGHGPDDWPYWSLVLTAAGIVAWRHHKDLVVVAAAVGPIVAATLLFATWTRPYESYWFMTLAPPVVLTVTFAIAAVPWRLVAQGISVMLLAVVLVGQPSRIADSKNFFRYPQYRPLLDGSRFAARRAPLLRHLRAGFEVHETTDVGYMYGILGGRIVPDGAFDATIQPNGTVTLTPATQP